MLLAIACVPCQLSRLDVAHDAYEDLFSARANSLSLSDNVPYDYDDLQQVQAEVLMAFYPLIQSRLTGMISRKTLSSSQA
jgi:hypothetical protein